MKLRLSQFTEHCASLERLYLIPQFAITGFADCAFLANSMIFRAALIAGPGICFFSPVAPCFLERTNRIVFA